MESTGKVQAIYLIACKAGGFAGGMLRKLRLRTTGRHFERANKGETGERKKVKREGEGEGEGEEFNFGISQPTALERFSRSLAKCFLINRSQNMFIPLDIFRPVKTGPSVSASPSLFLKCGPFTCV